jgi:hypothetical protein
MTERPSHVIAGLIAKRRELGGIIAELERRLAQHRADLTHIDGVLRVLAADLDPESIKPKRIYRRSQYFARNELSRLCLSVLRAGANEAVTVDFIAAQVVETRAFDTTDRVLRKAIYDQITPVLKRLHNRGVIERMSELARDGRAGGGYLN